MRYPINGCRTLPACPCGALVSNGANRCQKCIARFRWLRRKAARGFNLV
jgi:hypothetical protein